MKNNNHPGFLMENIYDGVKINMTQISMQPTRKPLGRTFLLIEGFIKKNNKRSI
jgi:prephenate dehydratase